MTNDNPRDRSLTVFVGPRLPMSIRSICVGWALDGAIIKREGGSSLVREGEKRCDDARSVTV